MKRIKVITDPTDLVPMLHMMDSEVKRKVFKEVSSTWCLKSAIVEKYGEDGIDALNYFVNMKLVQTRWEPTPAGIDMAYMSYYTTFHIETSCPVKEVGDILFIMQMSTKDFGKMEADVLKTVEEGEYFPRTIAKNLDITEIMLKCIVKRSPKLIFKGMKVMKIETP